MQEDTPQPDAVHANARREMLYRVRDWDTHFEVAQSKRVKGPLRWVPLSCKHDGKSYRRLMREANGAALYGAWCCSLAVAAKCPQRGTLADTDGPLTCEDLELKTGCAAAVFSEALSLFVELGWMTAEKWGSAGGCGRVAPQLAAESQSGSATSASDSVPREPDLIVPRELGVLLDALCDVPPGIAPTVRENVLPELVELWERARRDNSAALSRLDDVAEFVEAVRRANFAHGKPWFSVAWLVKRSREGPTRNFEKLALFRDAYSARTEAIQRRRCLPLELRPALLGETVPTTWLARAASVLHSVSDAFPRLFNSRDEA